MKSWQLKKTLTDDNYMEKAFFFRDRQAGVSSIFDPKQRLTLITPIA